MDRVKGDTFTFRFTTRAFATGIPTALAGSPVLSAMEDAVDTAITTGVSFTASSVAGLNLCTIDSSQADFEAGKEYDVFLSAGTVGGVSVVGEVVGHFSLSREAAAVDLANATDGLGALKVLIDAVGVIVTAIEAVTDLLPDSGALTTIGTDTARLTAARAGALTDWIDAGRLDALLDALIATIGTAGDGLTAINLPNQTMDIIGSITGNLSGSVGSVTGAVGSVAGNVDGSIGSLGATAKTDVNTEVDNALDTALPASPTAGSINDILDRQEELIVAGSAATGTLSTTTMTTDLAITVNDQYNGRIITFRKDTTTAALQGQQTDITDTVTTDGQLTFTALTTAPVNGDTFEIT